MPDPDAGGSGGSVSPRAGTGERFALAIDLGTSGLKVGLVSLAGTVAWTTGAELETALTDDGGAEQDAELWWQLITGAAKAALGSRAVPPGRIVAVSVTGQWASTVPVAADGTPVGPCVLWMDTRGGWHARRRFGGPISGYSARTLAAWIRKTAGAPSTSGADPIGHMLYLGLDRPDIAQAARWYLEPVDYVSMRFTGTAAASPASMTAAWLTDNRRPGRLGYDQRLVKLAGIDPAKLPPLLATGAVIGPVRADVAAAIGLDPGVLVVAGTPDLHSAALGTGTTDATRCHLALSTTSWVSCTVPGKKTDPVRQIATVPGVLPGGYLVANNHETAGACLRWLRDQVIGPMPGLATSRPGFDALCELAAAAPPGAGGVLFTPWLAGERSPVDDRNARAGFHNLSLKADLAAMTRAVLEGVAYNNRWLHEAVERFAGRRFDSVRVFGGGALSDLWCQIHADVMDRAVERIADPMHANLRGAAILAGIALGAVSPAEAGELAVVGATFRPDPASRAAYDRLYAEFPRLYKSQKPMFARLATSGLHRPGLLTVAHVPEHPLVPAGQAEVAPHPLALGGGETGAELVGDRDDVTDLGIELVATIGVDPALVARVGRAAAEQVLADLPVDPVAGQHGADAFRVRAALGGSQQVGVVGERRGRLFRRIDRRGIDAEVGKQRLVQAHLDRDDAGGMPGEQLRSSGVGCLARHVRQRAGILPQVERVLDDIEDEAVLRQAAVCQPGEERVRQDGTVNVGDAVPQLAGETIAHARIV